MQSFKLSEVFGTRPEGAATANAAEVLTFKNIFGHRGTKHSIPASTRDTGTDIKISVVGPLSEPSNDALARLAIASRDELKISGSWVDPETAAARKSSSRGAGNLLPALVAILGDRQFDKLASECAAPTSPIPDAIGARSESAAPPPSRNGKQRRLAV